MELHHSLCKLIDGAFAVCSKEELGSILAKMDAVPTKPKSIPQILEVFRSSRGKEMSAKSGEISSALSCVLSQLETYIYIRKCPFPHVIRTGTIFIPMLVVKETLFPQLEGALVDQVLQEHRVELRPTTLSEERHLTQVQQRGCSSKLRRLLSLKHLPGIYPDLLKLYCDASLRTHLGTECDAPVQTEPSETPASPPPHHGHQATAKQLRPGLHFQRKRRKGRRRNPLNRTFVGASEKDAAIRVRDKRGRLKAATLRGSSSFRNSSQVTVQQIKSQKLLKGVWGRRKKKPGMGGKTKQKRAFEKSRAAGLVLKLKRMPLRGQAGGRERGFSPQESCGIKVQLTEVTSEQSGPAPKKPLPRLAHAALSSKKLRASAVAGSLRSTRSTSKVLHLRRSVVQIKFRRLLSLRPGTPRGRRRAGYPDLVGKRIRHLYEEKDKSEVWYQGMVVRVHEKHPNPLKTVYEVKYDSEPEWQYYLELLQDYRKGWLVLDD
ncbi:uncharacterized protein C15orf39 homolog [Polypterus senegalus]|uniref:uncharacterized protein C15orf39 homolog n=1 Tax=Polypterus senegalus TaxID=55291 RepID=UPI00196577CE|nr:uncharacterized protein C15orf39 homolog [Polypterus senegalus]